MEPAGDGRSRAEGEGESQDEQGESTVEEAQSPPWRPSFCSDLSSSGSGITFSARSQSRNKEAQSPPWRPSFCSDLSSSGSGITFSARSQSRNKGRWRRGHPAPKEHLFDKVLTPADLGSRLVIPKQDARRLRDPTGKGVVQLEDPSGKRWSFSCVMGKICRRYSLTQRWRRFVKENGLHAGDTVSFYRGVGAAGQRRLFIDWKLQSDDACPHLRMQPPMYPCSAFSIRELSQQLAHVRATISPSSKALVSFSWLTNVRSLAGDTEDHLRDLHYRMMLAFLGVDCQKVKPNVSENSSKARSTSSSLQGASPAELTVATIAEKLKGLEIGRPELSVSATQNSSKLLSVNRLVLRCIHLCRGILGIMSLAGAEAKVTMEVPVFASDDLTYVGRDRDKVSMIEMDSQKIPAEVINPIYLLPCFIRSLQYLDLSSCSSLEHVPSCLCTLHDLSALNLSRCYSLHTLPVLLGMLQNLQILVLSNCQKLQNLPESLCDLPKLKFLDVSGCSRLEALPYSFVTLRQMEILNLSDCKRLKELPQPFGILQELKYLNLSRCHGLNMDVECKLANLMCVTLSPHNNGQGFSDSFRDLAIHLDMSRWWNKSQIHPQCHPKASSFRTYKRLEQSIIKGVLPGGSDDCDVTIDQIVTWICIVGESGMGKTDLVHRIYNDQLILDTFDLRIWAPTCDKKRLLGQIVEFTTCSYCYDSPLSVLEEIVIQELTGKKFLLVLDDCDNEIPHLWNDLRKIFNVCSKGSSVIITTKSKQVADLVGAMQICYLNSLSKEDCFMIFQEHVLGGLDINNYPLLKNIGWKLVEKCGGNALCIKSLSGLLCHSEIGLDQMDMLVDGILPALRLCYDLLPSHLQQCFKFCSLFPKDYYFTKHQIVRLWIAQGFIFPEEGSQSEETGENYFDELLCRSFFQRSPFHNDKENKFVMHELFHDLAYSVSKNECFRCEEPFCSLPENISHLSLVPSNYKTLALTKEIKELQSLLVVKRSFPVIKILHMDDLYWKYRFLRALNLSSTDILQLPCSIQNMKHLRFLALNNTKIKGLPFEIGHLATLQTLELKDCCHLTDLPGSISNLTKLRHLDLQKEPGNFNVGMPNGIGRLTDLQTLTVFNIGNDLLHCSVVDLKNLSGLMGHVHITGLENIKIADDAREANIVGKHFLEALTLEWSCSNDGMEYDLEKEIANEILQSLQPSSNIKELVIRNYAGNLFPSWMHNSYLCNIISVTLDNCQECSELPYLGYLPSLKSLFIQKMNSVETFGIDCNPLATEGKRLPRFPSLEVLTLWEMYDLEFWVGISEEDFPQIRRLSISRCPKLINLPPLLSLVHLTVHCGDQVPTFSELPSLESLKIESFHKIRSITFPHQLKMLKKLEINDCKELSSMFSYSLSVSDLKVVRCQKLDLVGSSLEDHVTQKVGGGRNGPTRRSMVLKIEVDANVHLHGWRWLQHGEKNIFGFKFPRSYYRCIHRNSTGCPAIKILQPMDIDLNTMYAMYISEHNHDFSNETYLQQHSELGTTRKRKEPDASGDENTTKRNDFFR